jgi:hypothetical protein
MAVSIPEPVSDSQGITQTYTDRIIHLYTGQPKPWQSKGFDQTDPNIRASMKMVPDVDRLEILVLFRLTGLDPIEIYEVYLQNNKNSNMTHERLLPLIPGVIAIRLR